MARATTTLVTLRKIERETLEYIQWHQERHGMPPTTMEVGSHFGIGFGPAYRRIKALIKKRYLRRREKIARGIKVLRNPDGTLVRAAK
jgi:SOS-response transcriptional repressor LexA